MYVPFSQSSFMFSVSVLADVNRVVEELRSLWMSTSQGMDRRHFIGWPDNHHSRNKPWFVSIINFWLYWSHVCSPWYNLHDWLGIKNQISVYITSTSKLGLIKYSGKWLEEKFRIRWMLAFWKKIQIQTQSKQNLNACFMQYWVLLLILCL